MVHRRRSRTGTPAGDWEGSRVVSQRYRRVSRLGNHPVQGSPPPLIPQGTSIPVEEVASDCPLASPAASQTQVKILIDTGIRDFKQNIEMEIRATATKLGWDGLAIGLFEDAVEWAN